MKVAILSLALGLMASAGAEKSGWIIPHDQEVDVQAEWSKFKQYFHK
jgi:hypothetical protein